MEPIVVGLLVSLVTLFTFLMFFMFAFDVRFLGAEQSLDSLVREQSQQLEDYHLELKRQQLDVTNRVRFSDESDRLEKQIELSQKTLVELNHRIELDKLAINQIIESHKLYKDEYRLDVRKNAEGVHFDSITTITGKTYKNVFILRVTPIGIEIRHEDGIKRIPSEQLPEAMSDQFQFDPEQRDAALKNEQANWNEHEHEIISALDQEGRSESTQNAMTAKTDKERKIRAISEKRAEILKLSQPSAWPTPSQKKIVHGYAFFDNERVLKHEVLEGLRQQLDQMLHDLR